MDQYQPSDYLEWSKESRHLVVVHVVRKKVVAIMHVYVESGAQRDGECLVLDMLAVDQAFRGKGIGPALILVADDVARQLSINELRLEALNPGLIGFYQRFGYERFGDPIPYVEWGEVYPMRKHIA